MTARGPIQLSPPGLLGLLQLKADGRSVPLLDDTCSPSLEMGDYWLRAASTLWTQAASIAIAAGISRVFSPFSTGPITVPNGQWWYIHQYAVALSTGAAGSATRLALAWSPQVSFWTPFPSYQPYNLGASEEVVLAIGDVWLPPGSRLGLYCDTVVGASGLAGTLRLLNYTPCPG